MKPYGRDKKYIGGPNKVDRHPIPKRKFVNWWEVECSGILPRTTIKANAKKQIDEELK